MNRIYRSIWSESLGTWIAVAENAKSKTKGSGICKKLLANSLLLFSCSSWALPTGEQVVSGQVNVARPNATQMQIQQNSQKSIVNWQGFSINPNEAVNIQQPNPQAALLNRVIGMDASVIQGQLNANGQVYLVNPNGVLFSNTAQVDVGGLIATTHEISNADFLNDIYHFTDSGATGVVTNQGTIKVPVGGMVALIGNQVSNEGSISTPGGTTALAAGKTVDLDFQGNGLVEVKVPEAALNAQVSNKGAIFADGGRVVLSAQAANDLSSSVINAEGVIQAKSLVERNGEIILDGGNAGITQVNGTLDVSGRNAGGTITVTGQDVTINESAKITAQALESGTAGTIKVLGGMDSGTLNVAGTLDASAPNTGNGGFIETSAGHLKIADTAKISTLGVNGKNGTWLIDPFNFTIAANGGDITGSQLSSLLGSNSVNIWTSAGTNNTSTNPNDLYPPSSNTPGGDIFVNDAISWSANTTLTLNAERNIDINASISHTGSSGGLTLNAGLNTSLGGGAIDSLAPVAVGTFTLQSGTWKQVGSSLPAFSAKDFRINSGATFIRALSGDGSSASPYKISDIYGLQGMDSTGMLDKNYQLANNINASTTSNWNSGEGFKPIGDSSTNSFTGNFNGLNNVINGLFIKRPGTDNVGLFGYIGGSSVTSSIIKNIGLTSVNIQGNSHVGGLVGSLDTWNNQIDNAYTTGTVSGNEVVGGLVGYNGYTDIVTGNISNSYSTASVTGGDGSSSGGIAIGGLIGYNSGIVSNSFATGTVLGKPGGWSSYDVGGLVGQNNGTIINSYATGNVTGEYDVGGLVGSNNGEIQDAYSTGSVTGTNSVGGLVGSNNCGECNSGIINNTYATGLVTGSGNDVGGLVGFDFGNNATASFWNMDTTGQTASVGGTGLTTAQMKQMATFSNAGWNINNVGGSSAVWRIYEGSTYPLLRSFLMPLTITLNSDGTVSSYSLSPDFTHLFGSGLGTYSDQLGFDISFVTLPPPPPLPSPVPVPIDTPPEVDLEDQISSLQNKSTFAMKDAQEHETTETSDDTVSDDTDDFANNDPINPPCTDVNELCTQKNILPVLTVKNSAGRVKRLQMSANRQYLSLLLEDGSVRVWDFQRGMQRQVLGQNKKQPLTDISAVDDKGELMAIANKAGIGAYDVISSSTDASFNKSDIRHFVTSNDGNLLLLNSEDNNIMLWSNKQNQRLWQLPYQRGSINGFAMTDNKQFAAVLGRQLGSYLLNPNLDLKQVTDAIGLIDLATGKIIKSLPNLGEHVVYMGFKNKSAVPEGVANVASLYLHLPTSEADILQIGLASGEMLEWNIKTDKTTRVANFSKPVNAVDAYNEKYSYILKDGTVQVSDKQGEIYLSIKNKDNPVQHALLLEDSKKLITVLANGDLALWDIPSNKKMLRLFSTLQGWTVMDAFGRFDGTEEAMENFVWLANEEGIPLDHFSESYYEPGLLSNVVGNEDYLTNDVNAVQTGINLPPKVDLQIASQQNKEDKVAIELNLYDRGGGINSIKIYHNGKLLNNQDVVLSQTAQTETTGNEHRILNLSITPSAGQNTLKVASANEMGIENNMEISFDGKTKAYDSSVRLLAVGLNNYSDKRLNLSYSVADARLIEETIKAGAKVSASKSLYNQNATKSKILAELKEISQGAQKDVLVIYFAGHGVAVGKEWYFLPYETKLQSDVEKIVTSGIKATELSEIFKNSKIQHIMLLLDACYSGAGMDVFGKLENGQRYFSRQLSRSLGITVVTATAKDQQAAELQSLGHGLFTYMLAQEMSSKNGSEPITAHTIAKSIVKSLPVFSKKQIGSVQDPAVYTHGSDFVLTNPSKEQAEKTADNVAKKP
jgi:filamentous hemagglutinin family protein